MKYILSIVVVQDNPLEQKKLINAVFDTVSIFCDEDAGIAVGPLNIETLEDFDLKVRDERGAIND